MRYLKTLGGTSQDMMSQILAKSWTDGVKENALDVVVQYAEFLNVSVSRPNFRAYDNRETYVPSPEMVRTFLYRVRSLEIRARIKIAVETGASAGEVFNLKWSDLNLASLRHYHIRVAEALLHTVSALLFAFFQKILTR